ncbi:sca1 complex protein phr [Condylostylus longicornis]|uniref:sca1 complex protein phr n=1 Tax=Condylostylus longicornis TaxID=2530218 RepID=UPI00244E1DE3|nr:sca1 complex protein phr [Condylostylus longicornis]
METKLERQSQFPATFPDTFKDFFAMMNEDEDHIDLFSNLLEDKVIPRNNKYPHRRCGGSLRCTNTNTVNVGRSSSFRVNRPSTANFCRHVKYCCLHQKHHSQNFLDYHRCQEQNKEHGEDEDDDGDDGDGLTKIHRIKNHPRKVSNHSLDYKNNSDDNDTIINIISSTPCIPYVGLRRLTQQQQQQKQQYHKQQEQQYHDLQQQQQHHHQQQQFYSHHQLNKTNAFHSKENLPRIAQQQCGLREAVSGSTLNLEGCMTTAISSAITETTTSNVDGAVGITGVASASVVSSSSSRNSPTVSTANRSGNFLVNESGGNITSQQINKMNRQEFIDKKLNTSRSNNIMPLKSPVLNRRRASSIAATLLATDSRIFRNAEDFNPSWSHNVSGSARERLAHVKSPVHTTPGSVKLKPNFSNAGGISGNIDGIDGNSLTFKQAIVSPQNLTSPNFRLNDFQSEKTILNSSNSTNAISISGIGSPSPNTTKVEHFLSGISNNCTNSMTGPHSIEIKQKQRMRTSSMPVETRKPRLAEMRRAAIHCADVDIEYYRLRSFSITSHGICNLGDSLRSRRSRSINSVTSTATSSRNNSNASRTSDMIIEPQNENEDNLDNLPTPTHKIAMLGSSGVGKTALTYQFTTSDYICAYDLSLDDDYGQKTVSVLVDGIQTDLEIIDHPACEMSTEAFCSTYNVDLFVVVYSVVDRNSFKSAEKILQYLKENEMLLVRGAILVANKIDLERQRQVTRQAGRKLAKEIGCKFIETSSGLDHNVDELLVGCVAQVKLNPQRIENLSEKDKQRLSLGSIINKHRRLELPKKKFMKQASICKDVNEKSNDHSQTSKKIFKSGPIKKVSKRILNLENILKVGESEVEDDDDGYRSKLSNIGSSIATESTKLSSISSTSNEINTKKSQLFDVVTNLSAATPGTVSAITTTSGSSIGFGGKLLRHSYDNDNQITTQNVSNLTDGSCSSNSLNLSPEHSNNSCKKSVSNLSTRTKTFLSSVLKFKKNLNVKRRNSSSCSDLFVI